ncbi:uncharacterized protein L199_004632 [Kwoniella botswanensis]|uniref:uncharacterized protein n=1 Tax=Kwoniella botswanensis TaxID=1268659 RepID=UPI00315CD3BD
MPYPLSRGATQNGNVDREITRLPDTESLEPQSRMENAHLPTHRISSLRHRIGLPADGDTINLWEDADARDSFDWTLKLAIDPLALHAQAIHTEDAKIDSEMDASGIDPWDRRTNHKAAKSVTENTLESILGLGHTLLTFIGTCHPVYFPQRENQTYGKTVTTGMIAHHRFSLSSLGEDVKSKLIENDIFARFRTVGFTMKLLNPSSLYQRVKEDMLQANEGVREGEKSTIPITAVNDLIEFRYQTSETKQQFELMWDLTPERTQVLPNYESDGSVETLRQALNGSMSTIIGVTSVSTVADDISWYVQSQARLREQAETRQRIERESQIHDFLASIQEVNNPGCSEGLSTRRAIIAQAESEYRGSQYGWLTDIQEFWR